MPTWRCPHCGTPQAEAARCWVCKRSSTSCATCRHFRRSIAAQLGYCGLDARRRPLLGSEIRGCWTEASAAPAPTPTVGVLPVLTDAHRPIDFVPVGSDAPSAPRARRRRANASVPAVRAADEAPAGLWSELEA